MAALVDSFLLELTNLTIKGLTVKKFIAKISIATFTLLMAVSAGAVPISSDLTITGSVSLALPGTTDQDLAIASTGFGFQTATTKSILGGTTSTSSATNLTVTGDNPQGGQLTQINDGVGVDASVSSLGFGETPFFVFDYTFDLFNASLTEDYTISFAVNFDTSTDALTVSDSYSKSIFVLENPVEFFFSDLISDGIGNNKKNGVDTGNIGGIESDSGLFSFDILLLAGGSANFTGEVILEGGVFDAIGYMSAINNSFIYISDVSGSSPPTPPTDPIDVPAPSTPILLLMGLICLVERRIRA